jgi:hypothetical protein
VLPSAPYYSNAWIDSNADNNGYSDAIAQTHG